MKKKPFLFAALVVTLVLNACSAFVIRSASGIQPTPVIEVSTAVEYQDEAATASISGWVWHDQCDSGEDGEAEPTSMPIGCIEQASALGKYHANGMLDTNELPIESVVVKLRRGDCSATDLTRIASEMTTLATDLSYSFVGLKAGIYCVSIDPQEEPNFTLLRPGLWTYPYETEGLIATTVTLSPGENKFDVNFGWDYQFK